MLKCLLLIFIGVGVMNAAPVHKDVVDVKLLNEKFRNHPEDGGYSYFYELDNGQVQSQNGYYKYVDEEHPKVLVVEGSYTFIAPDGITYKVTYIADENGYNPIVSELGVTYGSGSSGAEVPQIFPQAGISTHVLSLLG